MNPLLIVLTPVFNEAWILSAFLKATSTWADYIIVADQMSTDGSRNIYSQYDKVIVIDNPISDMHQARTRKLLFDYVSKIEGDKILFTLDADEFLSSDFTHTQSWENILNSKPSDVFEFRWMNLVSDMTKYSTWQPYYWAVHVDDGLFNGEFPDNFIHEWRLPWPSQTKSEQIYVINDISFIHFARANARRQQNKEKFYLFSTLVKEPDHSAIALFRQYDDSHVKLYDVPSDVFIHYKTLGIDLIHEINFEDEGDHYTTAILSFIKRYGIKRFSKLDVWDESFLKRNELKDPRSFVDKTFHLYLRKTASYSHLFVIRCIDKILKYLY